MDSVTPTTPPLEKLIIRGLQMPIHTATPDTTQTGLFCRVWCGGVNWA